MQKVHLGKTRSGELGFFTGNFLAMPFGGIVSYPHSVQEASEKATAFGFEFVPGDLDEDILTECRATEAWEKRRRDPTVSLRRKWQQLGYVNPQI